MSGLWWTLGAVIIGSMLLVFSAWVFGDEWLVWRSRKKVVAVVDPIANEVKRRSVERRRAHDEWSSAWVAALRETEPEPVAVAVGSVDREYVVESSDGTRVRYRPGDLKAQAEEMLARKQQMYGMMYGMKMPQKFPVDGGGVVNAG